MDLKTLIFIHKFLEKEVRFWRGVRIGDEYKQTKMARDEVKKIIGRALKQSASLRNLAYQNNSFMPITVPFNIEVDIDA